MKISRGLESPLAFWLSSHQGVQEKGGYLEFEPRRLLASFLSQRSTPLLSSSSCPSSPGESSESGSSC